MNERQALDDSQKNRPDANTYWVVPGRLLAGEYPGKSDPGAAREKVRAFLDAGVTFFLDLTEDGELAPYAQLVEEEARAAGVEAAHCRKSIRDVSVPSSREHMADILDAIDAAIEGGRTVYVHCWGGIGRTGTVVGCYLVRHGMTGAEALAEIERLWPNMEKSWRRPRSPETSEQAEWVRAWVEIER